MKLQLSIVGKTEYIKYSKLLPLFFTSEIQLQCVLTKRNEISLGKNGLLKIQLWDFELCHTKDALSIALKNKGDTFEDYLHYRAWLQKNELKFTDALINNIFRATTANSLWINKHQLTPVQEKNIKQMISNKNKNKDNT